jgi:hypothetical protein
MPSKYPEFEFEATTCKSGCILKAGGLDSGKCMVVIGQRLGCCRIPTTATQFIVKTLPRPELDWVQKQICFTHFIRIGL